MNPSIATFTIHRGQQLNIGFETLTEGTPVKVNCYHGVVRRVITAFSTFDPFRGRSTELSLGHPVYEIELDTTRKFSWGDRRIHLPVGTRNVRLFADEFEILPNYQLRRAS